MNLTKIQNQILELLAKGFRYNEICDELSLNRNSLGRNLKEVRQMIGVDSTQLAVKAWLELSEQSHAD